MSLVWISTPFNYNPTAVDEDGDAVMFVGPASELNLQGMQIFVPPPEPFFNQLAGAVFTPTPLVSSTAPSSSSTASSSPTAPLTPRRIASLSSLRQPRTPSKTAKCIPHVHVCNQYGLLPQPAFAPQPQAQQQLAVIPQSQPHPVNLHVNLHGRVVDPNWNAAYINLFASANGHLSPSFPNPQVAVPSQYAQYGMAQETFGPHANTYNMPPAVLQQFERDLWTQYTNVPAPPSATPPPQPSPTPRDILFGCVDIVSEIVGYLQHWDLKNASLVSKAFNVATTPLLYRRLPWCLQNKRSLTFKKRFAKSFRIKNHNQCACAFGNDLSLHMRTVILDASFNYFHPGNCHSCAHIQPSTRTVFANPSSPGSRNDYCLPDHDLIDTLPSNEIVIYVQRLPTGFNYARQQGVEFEIEPPLPTPTKKVTIVVLPIFWGTRVYATKDMRQCFVNTIRTRYYARDLVCMLAEFGIEGPNNDLTIVGLEDANPFALVKEHWKNRDIRAGEVKDSLLTEADRHFDTADDFTSWTWQWSAADRAIIRSRYKFMTFKDYLETGQWRDELDFHLVGRWLNEYDRRDRAEPATRVPKAACK